MKIKLSGGVIEGKIIEGIDGFYYVKTKEGVIECKARGKFGHKDMKPMVGDNVNTDVSNEKGVVEDIYDRSSELIRPTVANVTQAFVAFAIKNPDTNFDPLDRFLILCEYNSIKVIACLNKVDLASEGEKEEVKKKINDTGYDVLFINAKEGLGIELLKGRLSDNEIVPCGPPGAGKSILINTLINRMHMETGAVSEKIGRGKHTIRHSELTETENGYLVDSPGLPNVDISFMNKEEFRYCLLEFEEYNHNYKFRGCLHNKEPERAVRNVLQENRINETRYNFYIRILEELLEGGKHKW